MTKNNLTTIFLVTICGLLAPAAVFAASFYLSPDSGSYDVGEEFSVGVYVDAGNTAINAARGVLSFDQDLLEIQSLDKEGSIFSLWPTEPRFSNIEGTVNFSGGLATPGFSGHSGRLFTLEFEAEEDGEALVEFFSGAILANDEKGTNVLTIMDGGNYTIGTGGTESLLLEAPQIFSDTHPEQDEWYNKDDLSFYWFLPSEAIGASYLLNEKPDSTPGNLSDGMLESKTFQDIGEGTTYFHLKLRNEFGWSETGHYRTQIDMTPPASFKMSLIDDRETINLRPTILLKAEDELSGISHFLLRIDGEKEILIRPEELKYDLFRIPAQELGLHTIIAQAYDKAGNYLEGPELSVAILPGLHGSTLSAENIDSRLIIGSLLITFLTILVFLLLAALLLGWYKQQIKEDKIKKEIEDIDRALRVGTKLLRYEVDQETKGQKPVRIKDVMQPPRSARKKLIEDLEIIEKEVEKEIKEAKDEVK